MSRCEGPTRALGQGWPLGAWRYPFDPTGERWKGVEVAEGSLQVIVQSDGERLTLAMSGEIDMATAPILRSSLEKAASESEPRVVVDLAAVTFMDSSGLGVLATAHQSLEEAGRRLILRGPQGTVRRVLNVSGLDQAIDIE